MMRYEISTEPGDVRPGDLVVFRLQTKNSVKWSCGPGALLHGRQGRAGHRAYHRLDTRVRGL